MKFYTVFIGKTNKIINDALIFKDVGLLGKSMSRIGVDTKIFLKSYKKEKNLTNNMAIYKFKTVFALFLLLYNSIRRECNGNKFVVNLYHNTLSTVLISLVLKIFFPKVFVYVKLDMDIPSLERTMQKGSLLKEEMRKIKNYISEKCINLYSSETWCVYENLKELKQFKNKIIYLPNGVDDDEIEKWDAEKFEKIKTNTIIAVGRIGSYQKNHEFLLDLLEQLDFDLIKKWKVKLVGPIESIEIPKRVNEINASAGREFIELCGNISNREELKLIYKSAKVCIFTSRYEGASLAMMEAAAHACKILSTDVGQIRDINKSNETISIIDSRNKELSSKIFKTILSDSEKIKMDGVNTSKTIYDNFKWSLIAKELEKEIDAR